MMLVDGKMDNDTQINEVLQLFVKAAQKQKRSMSYGAWGHSVVCNYQRDEGNGEGRCNCGVADMLTALNAYDSFISKNI